MEYSVTKMVKREGSTARYLSLGVMTYVYVVGELSHFLLGIVSRPMSQELHYGDHACLPNPNISLQSDECHPLDATSCDDLREEDNQTTCVWDYSGLGLQYQVLAGPAFVAVFTTAGVIIGVISDRFNRESAFTPTCSSMISDMFTESRRALALGIFNWGVYFGYGLSYAVGNFITADNIADMGWRWSYIVTGMMGVVATLLFFLVVKEPPRGSQVEVKSVTQPTENPNTISKASGSDSEDSDTEMHNNNTMSIMMTPTGSQSKQELLGGHSGPKVVAMALFKPPMLMLALAACIRHTAGFSWAYNTQLYFLTYYPNFNIGFWVMGASIVGGSLGVTMGGFVSDRLVKKIGIRARLYVLAGSQLIATPFAAGVLFFPPPGAFFSLLGSYIFAEMWFGVLFAVLLELVPDTVHSTSIAVFLFVMNNVGGNMPVVVDPLSHLLTYRGALYIMYPGMYLASSVFFFLASFLV